jgi:alkanesulfonate monooxygenase SsuD/methylene tetrahydromethanopterin reductase-like flavin-dependent oxidoreductase (luciferase family)
MANPVRLGFLTHVEGHADLHTLYRRLIELFVAAEELGFDIGWIAQHHFEDGRSGAGAGASPFTLLAAVAENTSRIRLGTAVVTVPMENPLRLAEDAATVDVLSGGRVEFGIGSGFDRRSFQAFGVPIEQRRELTSSGFELIWRALDGQPLTADPHSIMQPQSPGLRDRIWHGVFSEHGARYVARAGSYLLLNRATYGYEERTDIVQRPWADAYLDEWAKHPSNRIRRPRVGLSRFIYPAADRATARRHLEAGVLPYARRMVGEGKFPAGLSLDGYLARLHCFYGHPDEIIASLRDEITLPVATDILCQVNPGVPTFDQTLTALELIAREIAPALGWRTAPTPRASVGGVAAGNGSSAAAGVS